MLWSDLDTIPPCAWRDGEKSQEKNSQFPDRDLKRVPLKYNS
jgi:hypothetical protein